MLIPYNWIAMGGDQNNLHRNYKMSSGHATPSFKVTMLLARPKLENQLLKKISAVKNLLQSYNWYYHQDLQWHYQWLTFVLLIWKIEGQNDEKGKG